MKTSRQRLFWSVLIAIAGCVGLSVLDRTAYASWAERITLTVLFIAAILMVLRNVRQNGE
jgi:hypothetical protein